MPCLGRASPTSCGVPDDRTRSVVALQRGPANSAALADRGLTLKADPRDGRRQVRWCARPGGDGGGAYIFDESFELLDQTLLNGSFTIEMWVLPAVGDLIRPAADVESACPLQELRHADIKDSGRGWRCGSRTRTPRRTPSARPLLRPSGEPPRLSSVPAPRPEPSGWTRFADVDRREAAEPNVWNHVAVTRELNTYRSGSMARRPRDRERPLSRPSRSSHRRYVESFIRRCTDDRRGPHLEGGSRPECGGLSGQRVCGRREHGGPLHFDGDGTTPPRRQRAAMMSLNPRSSFAPARESSAAPVVGGGVRARAGRSSENANIPELNGRPHAPTDDSAVGAALFRRRRCRHAEGLHDRAGSGLPNNVSAVVSCHRHPCSTITRIRHEPRV